MTKAMVFTVMIGVSTLFGSYTTPSARAQDIRFLVNAATFEPVGLAAEEFVVGSASGVDLRNLSDSWWKQLRNEHLAALRSADPALREQALRNVIYFRTHYPEQARFRRISGTVYEIYRLDRDEPTRLLALSALSALGDDDTMRQLARDVRLERSPRVRRLANHALAHHFSVER